MLSELLAMRAADPRRTPAISLLMRQQQHELDDEKNDAFLAAAGEKGRGVASVSCWGSDGVAGTLTLCGSSSMRS